jgi:hypothetical protein
VRRLVSLLICFHLAAVALAPLAFSTRPSPAIIPVFGLVQPYAEAVHINHGYAFFAPNPPAASSLLRYEVKFDDGRPTIVGVVPDRRVHWPRLYYHRHFMLSEQLSAKWAPPEPPADVDPRPWKAQREAYLEAWRSFENHLLQKHGGSTVTMEFFDHRPPSPPESLDGKPLNSPDLYRPRSERYAESAAAEPALNEASP